MDDEPIIAGDGMVNMNRFNLQGPDPELLAGTECAEFSLCCWALSVDDWSFLEIKEFRLNVSRAGFVECLEDQKRGLSTVDGVLS